MSKFLSRIFFPAVLILTLLISPTVNANSFDPNFIINRETLEGIPAYLGSPELIQSYLESKNSLLANYKVLINFEPNTILINPDQFKNLPNHLQPVKTVMPYNDQYVTVAQLVWMLSTQDFGNSCSILYDNICANNRVNTLNPAFILALIQKESGLVYGTNAQRDPNTTATQFLLDRVLGYYCFETSANPSLQEKQRSCYDENPEWKYFKGFFRQLYYGIRFLRLHEQMCNDDRNFGGTHSNNYKTGKSVTYNDVKDGKPISTTVTFGNGMTCALYLYTPHVYNSQFLMFNILNSLKASDNLIKYQSEDSKPIKFRIDDAKEGVEPGKDDMPINFKVGV